MVKMDLLLFLLAKVTEEDSADESHTAGLKQQLRTLDEKLSRSQESLAVAEREHKDLQKQLDESKKLYSMVQRKNTLLKEQLKTKAGSRYGKFLYYMPVKCSVQQSTRNFYLSQSET